MIRKMLFATAGVFALSVFALPASAGRMHMTSVDHTQGPAPVIHDNGVNDGRVCNIFYKKIYDPWTEDFVVKKVKQCQQF